MQSKKRKQCKCEKPKPTKSVLDGIKMSYCSLCMMVIDYELPQNNSPLQESPSIVLKSKQQKEIDKKVKPQTALNLE